MYIAYTVVKLCICDNDPPTEEKMNLCDTNIENGGRIIFEVSKASLDAGIT